MDERTSPGRLSYSLTSREHLCLNDPMAPSPEPCSPIHTAILLHGTSKRWRSGVWILHATTAALHAFPPHPDRQPNRRRAATVVRRQSIGAGFLCITRQLVDTEHGAGRTLLACHHDRRPWYHIPMQDTELNALVRQAFPAATSVDEATDRLYTPVTLTCRHATPGRRSNCPSS